MSEALRRILSLVKDGKLSEAQAEAMIDALDDEDHADAEPVRDDEPRHGRRRSRRHRRHRRELHSEELEELGLTIGNEVASIVDKSLRGLSSVLGARAGSRFAPTTWLNESNVNVMSKLHTPSGDNYECRDNNLTVSRLDDLNLSDSAFCDNELHAASIKDLTLDNGNFKGNELRGSSVKQVVIDHGDFTNCQLNGAQIRDVHIDDGKLDDCSFNGAQVRDLTIDKGSLAESLFNGAKLNDVSITGDANLKEVTVNGCRVQTLTIDGGSIGKLRMNGLNLQSVHFENSRLADVAVRPRRWREMVGYSGRDPSHNVSDLRLEGFGASRVEFIGCIFDHTTFKDCEIEDLTFTDVDFSGLTLDSREAFAALAGEAAA